MANIRKRIGKNGVISYQIRISRGTNSEGIQLKPLTKTIKVPTNIKSQHRIDEYLQKEIYKLQEKYEQGYDVENKQTFEEYSKYVMNIKQRSGIKVKTVELYERLLKRINKSLGQKRLSQIRPSQIDDFYDELLKEKNKINGGNLSPKTIREYHRLLCTIFSQAEKELIVPYNVAQKATPPKLIKKEAQHFELDDIQRILFYLNNEPLKWQVAINLLIVSGCRRGEILGLKWDKVDFNNNTIKIDTNLLYTKEKGIFTDTPKTEQSNRVITLPKDVMALLKQHKIKQQELALQLGSYFKRTNFVFTQDNGNPMFPDSLTDYCKKFEDKYNKIIQKQIDDGNKDLKLLPHLNPHKFRHTAASLLISKGVDIITVSKRLGHAKISTTTDIYSHVLKESDKQASNVISDMIYKKEIQI